MNILDNAEVVKQGAEAKVYKIYLHSSAESSNGIPVLIKHRFPKQYRHPNLDVSLTKARVSGEARALLKCLKSGVNVPGIRMVDAANGTLGIEWIDGKSIRTVLGSDDDSDSEETDELIVNNDKFYGVTSADIMHMIGVQIAKMHAADVIHGDLTTSNMMLRQPSAHHEIENIKNLSPEIVLIDFGLSYFSPLAEDKAVDLYVLERAFSSTHPDSESLFASVLKAYEETCGSHWKAVGRKLDEVRLRGRKRSMVG